MLLLGHRGAVSPESPENTVVAVDRALLLGADGVEVDVRLTADGHVVCHHDAGFRRTAKDARLVAAVAYGELPRVRGHAIPLLDEVLDTVGVRGRVVVELKPLVWPPGARAALVGAVSAVVANHPRAHVVVSSFDRPSVGLMQRQHDVPTALLGRPRLPLGALLRWAHLDGHAEAHAHLSSLHARPDLVESRDGGPDVVGWTINDGRDLVRLATAGLSAAICDDPASARLGLERVTLATAG